MPHTILHHTGGAGEVEFARAVVAQGLAGHHFYHHFIFLGFVFPCLLFYFNIKLSLSQAMSFLNSPC